MPSPDRPSPPDAASPRGIGRPWPRRSLPALVGIILSLGLLAWALRGVSFAEIGRHLRTAEPAPLVAAVIIATLTFPLRLVRWRLLFRRETGAAYPSAPLWHAIAVGFMANNLLPLRAGELVRSYTASRLARARFTTVLSSIAVERIFDAISIVALLTVALLSPDLPSSVTVGGTSVAHLARVAGVVAGAGLCLAIAIVAAPLTAERLVRQLVRSTQVADRIVSLVEGIRQGFSVLRTPGRLAAVVFWSLVLWLVNALGFYVGFAAFHIPVSYLGALLMQGLLILGISIPSTPGFFGPFEAIIVAVLALYRIPGDVAFSYAIAFHVTSFVPITLLGLWSLTRIPGGFKGLRPVAP